MIISLDVLLLKVRAYFPLWEILRKYHSHVVHSSSKEGIIVVIGSPIVGEVTNDIGDRSILRCG